MARDFFVKLTWLNTVSITPGSAAYPVFDKMLKANLRYYINNASSRDLERWDSILYRLFALRSKV